MYPSIKKLLSRRNQPSFKIVLLLSIFCFLTATTPASAQTDPTELRVKAGLEELQKAIATAKEILAAFDNRQGRVFLTQAEAFFQKAQTNYNQALATNVTRARELLLKEALGNILLAKANLERAVKLTLDIPLTRLRNEFAELLRRAEQTDVGQVNRGAQKFIYQARRTQIEAERAAMRDPPRAIKLYQFAIDLLKKLSEPAATLHREKERYENLENRAREAIETSKNSAALLVFEQARKQAGAALEAFRKGEVVLAQQLYHGAIRLLLRTIDLAMAGRKNQDVGQNEVALLQDLIQMAEQEIKEGADTRASLFLERARILVREAEAATNRQQPQEAKWRLELARNFVDKAMRKADRGAMTAENLAPRFNEALQELARDIEEVGANARDANKPEATPLVELAINAYKAAENAGQKNRIALGFQLIRMAQHLLLRAETMLRDSSAASEPAPARETVLQRLTLIENTAQGISNEGDLESCQIARTEAAELLQRSRAALDRGQIRLALAIMEVANDLIQNCLRK